MVSRLAKLQDGLLYVCVSLPSYFSDFVNASVLFKQNGIFLLMYIRIFGDIG